MSRDMTENEIVEKLANQHLMGRGYIDWNLLEELMSKYDRSQHQVAKLTGISQSWISRRLRNRTGIPYPAMDSHKDRV